MIELDALDGDRRWIDDSAKSKRGQDRELMRRVETADVEGGIGFRVTEPLRLAEALRESQTIRFHSCQDVVGGAVQDAIDALDGIAGQSLAQGFDDRNAARDRSLEGERDAFFLGERGEPHAVLGEQRLVCGDEGFARAERGFRRRKRGALLAPDQFDEKIDAGGPCQSHAIVEPGEAGEIDPPLLGLVAGRNSGNRDLPADPAPQRLGLPAEQRYNRGSNGAETGNADAQGRRHGCKAREAGGWETTKSRRQMGFLPDFRDAIKAAAGPRGRTGCPVAACVFECRSNPAFPRSPPFRQAQSRSGNPEFPGKLAQRPAAAHVNSLVAKLMVNNQRMRWSQSGAHLIAI